jgi:hypothetical protein
MKDWKDFVFLKVQEDHRKINIVKDLDYLFNEQGLIYCCKENGFELLFFTSSIALRFDFETKYRKLLTESDHNLIIVINNPDVECDELPYDFTKDAQILTVGLSELFPFLNISTLKMINKSILNKLFEFNVVESASDNLNILSSKKHILKYGYHIDLDLIINSSELLKILFEIHYESREIVDELKLFIVESLKQKKQFNDWPLRSLFFNANNFFDFLQERWSIFVDNYCSEKTESVCEYQTYYKKRELQYTGPELLPFEDKKLSVYLPRFFYEDFLKPISYMDPSRIHESWINAGILSEVSSNKQLKHLKEKILKQIPKPNAFNKEWIELAFNWSKLLYLFHQSEDLKIKSSIDTIREQIDNSFLIWLQSSYSMLSTLPPSEPVMNHQIIKRLNRDIQCKLSKKVALIVVDGLSLEQWFVLKQQISQNQKNIKIEEKAVFSWIPTLTSVSRQAIFSGKMPVQFEDSISTTAKEGKFWLEFWKEQGFSKRDVFYGKYSGDEDFELVCNTDIFKSNKKILGIVINKVDDIMHGMQNGSLGMKSQIELWCKNSLFRDLISTLLEKGFAIWITSDHGNIECQGNGTINEGSLTETKGQRVKIYRNEVLKKQILQSNLYVHEWKPNGLPDHFYPVFAGGTTAFVKEGKIIVSHGGISLEEVIVPLVKIERINKDDK